MTEEVKQNKMRILKNFIEKEIANSTDQYELSVTEMQAIFENSIKAIEELSGEEIDVEEFSKFLKLYKIIKVAEKIIEEVKCDKYLADCKKRGAQ
ncbi:MAG: hypothetical protein IJH34_03440 [Romboutsia sp.]|nr:hypothetical protein [Romboutsia sp.]